MNRIQMPTDIRDQIGAAYRRMADEAHYRPKAPSDGFGNIAVPFEELDLEDEARRYAEEWWAEEGGQDFLVGCCDYDTRPATIFAIEAARNLCAGYTGDESALALLRMAVAAVESGLAP